MPGYLKKLRCTKPVRKLVIPSTPKPIDVAFRIQSILKKISFRSLGNNKKILPVLFLGVFCGSSLAHASVESSLIGLKSVLLGSILPIFAVLGLAFAGFSFLTGNPDSKKHLAYAVTGSIILFGAQSIVDLIERVVQ